MSSSSPEPRPELRPEPRADLRPAPRAEPAAVPPVRARRRSFGASRRKAPRRLKRFSILRLLLLLLVYGAATGAATLYLAVRTINRELPPSLTQLLDYQPNRKSVVLSSDGEEVGTFSIENRKIVPLDRVPPHVTAAFVSAEDGRFYKHPGFDVVGIGRAAWKNFRSDGIRQGGSTITQQILKQTLLAGDESFDANGLPPQDVELQRQRQKYQRKMKEVILAVRLERELTKAEILAIYLNHVYLGHGAYGVAAAAEAYFGKDVENLTIAEAAMLAGLIASPSKYAPHRNMKLARDRQSYVLGRMRDDGYISNTELESARAEPIALVNTSDINHLASPYFVEHVRRTAQTRYGTSELFRGGLRFYATLDTRAQDAAEDALRHGLEALDRRLGFRGPIGQLAARRPRRLRCRRRPPAARPGHRLDHRQRPARGLRALRSDGRRARPGPGAEPLPARRSGPGPAADGGSRRQAGARLARPRPRARHHRGRRPGPGAPDGRGQRRGAGAAAGDPGRPGGHRASDRPCAGHGRRL
ncbi:MAG: transglycosylase domain-containing protein [Myxococcales bacterium]|nr:transglycosylase domain-containing protein [Myxococcales bacterium]